MARSTVAMTPTISLETDESKEESETDDHQSYAHAILRNGVVEPRFELSWQEPKDKIHGPTNQLHCGLTEPRRSGCLSSEVAIQAHVVGKGQTSIVNLQEVGDKLVFPEYRSLNLVQNPIKDLKVRSGDKNAS